MAVSLRSSSTTGAGDAESSSVAIPVPPNVEVNDIVVASIPMWQSTSTNPDVTAPEGFNLKVNQLLSADTGFMKLKILWKRLTEEDSGSYTFSWTGAQWRQGQCIAIAGAKTTGDPIGDNFNVVTIAAPTDETPTTSLPSVDFNPFLLNIVSMELSNTQEPPIGFTEAQEANFLKNNYRIPESSGTFSASGGVLSVPTSQIAALLAIEPEDSGEVTTVSSISDIARENMLTDRSLIEPQSLSNVDLMQLVLADAGQTLVSKTDATAAVHLWRYLRAIREAV